MASYLASNNLSYVQETSWADRGTPLAAPLSPPFNLPSGTDHVTGAIPNIPLRNWRTQRHLSRAEMADRINATPSGVADRLPCDEERIRQGGCEAYISKPISVPRFIETIKSYLGDA